MIQPAQQCFHRLTVMAIVLMCACVVPVAAETVEVAPGVRVTKKSFPAPFNEQPFFGFVSKTAQMREADDKLVATVLKATDGNQQKAFEEAARRGWHALLAGDYPLAARRFNQASLFDPGRSEVFHAFGLIVFERFKDATYAEELLQIARRRPNPASNMNADYGRFLLILKRPRDAQPVLEQAVVDNPKFGDAWSNLAHARHLNGDDGGACAAGEEATKHAPSSAARADLTVLRARAKCS